MTFNVNKTVSFLTENALRLPYKKPIGQPQTATPTAHTELLRQNWWFLLYYKSTFYTDEQHISVVTMQ